MTTSSNLLKTPSSPLGETALHFWEIDPMFRCPVVGMCLSEAEQISILKKARVSAKGKSAFEIHELLVTSSISKNQLSSRIDLLLWQKFGREALHIHSLDENRLLAHWQNCFQNGDYTAAVWGAVTRPHLSLDAKHEIFGSVHMMMHKTAEQHSRDRQRLIFLEECLADQEDKIKMLSASRRQLQRDYDELAHRASALQVDFEREKDKIKTQTGQPIPSLENKILQTEAENQRLQAALEEKEKHIGALERQVAELEKTSVRYELTLKRQEEAHAKLRQETEDVIGSLLDKASCSEECPSFNVCQKRILIVGGIARMEAQYRRIIEDGGGVLEYHEGCMRRGARQLENSLKRADIILCPVSCNSHAACILVKNLGKKYKKPVHMLPNFSISAVSQALTVSSQ